MKWVMLVTAPDQLTAEMWRDVLLEQEVPATVKDTSSFLGVSPLPCRLMVPEDRKEDARAILEDHLGRKL
jgi:hypothetical protein